MSESMLASLPLLGILSVAAYVDRVYSEMGKFLAREYQDNIDSWEERVEPRLKLGRESIAQSASVLRQLSLAGIALIFGVQLMGSIAWTPGADWQKVLVTLAELAMVILIFDRLVPQVLFSRTRGRWVVRIHWLLQGLFFLILPITLLLGLLLSIAALAEPEDAEEEEHPGEAMDALLEAGEEEGILEESDRELVRSVVEFGDKVVREVMTPRPEIFAVAWTLTLKQFTAEIEEHVFSRVPVYRETLDNITGIAFAHDLLQVTDEDAETRTVAQIQRPAEFVPETKMVAELLREMQSEKQHMRIVIDEYGSVAGVVTIEDLLEAIVGSISDEHDEVEEDDAPVREESGAYVVTGTFEVSRLRELFADQFSGREDGAGDDEDDEDPTALRLPEHYESTTVGGLVSEIAGHIPLPGEVVEEEGLRLEVLASTDRRIDRIRVSLASGTPD
jgi:CBS domain containing-hemolysin-like protein